MDEIPFRLEGETEALSLVDRLRAIGGGVFYAINYGVVSNDASVNVTTNTANFQRALDAAEGGALILPAGEIRVGGPTAGAALYVPSGGVTIRGAGRFSTILRNATASACIAAVDADNVDISDICFDGAQVAQLPWQTGVMFRGVVRGSIKNCWLTRLGQGTINCAKEGFGGSDTIPNGTRQCEKIDISHNLFTDNKGTVSVVTKYMGAHETNISDNKFDNSSVIAISVESEHGFTLGEWSDSVIVCRNQINNASWLNVDSGNVCYAISISEQSRRIICNENIINGVLGNTLAAGIIINSSAGQSDTPVERMVCVGNVITDVTCTSGRAHGILIQTGDVQIKTLTINSNVIDSCEDGLTFETGASTKTLGTITDLAVIGNTITNCSEFGMWSANTSGSGELPTERAIISGNVVTDAGSHAISLFLKNAVLSSNVVTGAGGAGIVLQTGSSDCMLIGNRCTENAESGIQATGDRHGLIANQCLDNGQGGAASYGIYLVSGSRGQVINNRCSDTQGSPTQDTGIRAPAGALVQGNVAEGNATGPYYSGGPYASWVTTQYRPASVTVAADNAEHVILTETVPQNHMNRIGMGLRIRVGYFGTWTNNSVTFRLKLGATTLATAGFGLSATSREGTILWEVGQTGVPGARCSQTTREVISSTTTTRDDPTFDVSFDTSGGDQDITVTAQIVDVGDTMTVASFAVEHLGW